MGRIKRSHIRLVLFGACQYERGEKNAHHPSSIKESEVYRFTEDDMKEFAKIEKRWEDGTIGDDDSPDWSKLVFYFVDKKMAERARSVSRYAKESLWA